MQKQLKDIEGLRKIFPKKFLWGASVATHQVEGRNTNQWTEWEHATAARQAATAEARLGALPIWDDVKRNAKDPHNYISGRGVDHLNKYQLDFQLARKLNLNSMRSGIEWSRICPAEGKVEQHAITHYNDYFSRMHHQGLEPVLNLFHWSEPVWFARKGGFEKKENLRYWEDYVHAVLQNVDLSHVRYIITINEANSYAGWGYVVGDFPPGKKNIYQSLVVYRNLAKAHRIAYKMIKSTYPDMQVGVAQQFQKAVGTTLIGKAAAKVELYYSNSLWMKMAKYHDFIGFNYYFADYRKGISLFADASPKEPLNDLGWYMEPSGIEWVIRWTAKRWKGTPILIAENGVADMHDQYREWWLTETMEAVARCIKDKIPVIGYMHWSLLDNFEWQYGWWPKFGLIAVDRKTMQRKVKKSARMWAAWLGAIPR